MSLPNLAEGAPCCVETVAAFSRTSTVWCSTTSGGKTIWKSGGGTSVTSSTRFRGL